SATESPISVSLPPNSRNRRVQGVSCDRSSPEKVESLRLCRRLGSVSLIAIKAVTFATISLCRIFRSGAKDWGIPRNRVRDHVTEEKVSCPGQMRRLSQGSSRKAIGGQRGTQNWSAVFCACHSRGRSIRRVIRVCAVSSGG